jgi:hypothetical protein
VPIEEFVAPGILLAPASALYFDPVVGLPGDVRAIDALRDDAFHVALGARCKEAVRITKRMGTAQRRAFDARHQRVELCSSCYERETSQVLSVLREDVKDPDAQLHIPLQKQCAEARRAVIAAGSDFGVENECSRRQRRDGLRDLWEAPQVCNTPLHTT